MKQTILARSLAMLLAGFACVVGLFAGAAKPRAQEPRTVAAADSRVQDRHYAFPGTGTLIPYTLFIPSHYKPDTTWPLVVGLHGAGHSPAELMAYEGLVDAAEREGYIVVNPLGYHQRGGYGGLGPGIPDGVRQAGPTGEAVPANLGELSEHDVMNVLAIVRRDFNIDRERIYIWGHSMGGTGAFHLAARYPDLWAAVAVAAPGNSTSFDDLEKFRHLPTLVLKGDQDMTVPIARTRKMVERMRELGMPYVYLEVKGGDHTLFMSKNREMPAKLFSFFDVVRRSQHPAVNSSIESPPQ